MSDKSDTWVYIHWKNMDVPKCIGILSAQQAKGRKAFSFSYAENRFQKCWGRRKKSNTRKSLLIVVITPDRMKYTNDSINSKDVNKRNFYQHTHLSGS